MPVTGLSNQEIMAIKSIHSGTANSDQQQIFLDLVINKFCRTHDLPYFPESKRDTDFACGMQHVGKQILKYIRNNYQHMK